MLSSRKEKRKDYKDYGGSEGLYRESLGTKAIYPLLSSLCCYDDIPYCL